MNSPIKRGDPVIIIEGAPEWMPIETALVPRMTGAALASQEPVAEVLLVDGEKVIDASMAFFDSVELGTKLYLAAGAAPAISNMETTQAIKQAIEAMSPLRDLIILRQAIDALQKVLAAGAAPVQHESVEHSGELAYHNGRSAYELTKVPSSGWTLFGDMPTYAQAYWIAKAAVAAMKETNHG